jgi:transcriptional regulator with XRE-family HTH domain
VAPRYADLPEPETLTAVIADRVAQLRKERGFTAQRLADELQKLGVDWTRDTVTKFETRRRKLLDVTELLTLATVFEVPPVALLVDPKSPRVQVTPKVEVPLLNALWWLQGLDVLPGQTARPWLPADRARALYDALLDAQRGQQLAAAARRIGDEDPREHEQWERVEREALKRAVRVIDGLPDQGIAVPKLDDEIVDRMRVLGVPLPKAQGANGGRS